MNKISQNQISYQFKITINFNYQNRRIWRWELRGIYLRIMRHYQWQLGFYQESLVRVN